MAVKDIVVDELKKIIEKGNFDIIDVRTSFEYAGNHIKQARNIPMDIIKEEDVDWKKKVIFVCRSGHRSGLVANFFSKGGRDSYNLIGGMIAWNNIL